MYFVVAGAGEVGFHLAQALLESGHEVTVIEADRRRANFVQEKLGSIVMNAPADEGRAQMEAGCSRADALLALTEGDNRNLMAAQIAHKIFGVKQVIAKVNDPVRAQTYREMGINTFSRTTILGTLLHAMLQEDREVGEVLMRKALAHEADLVREPVKAR